MEKPRPRVVVFKGNYEPPKGRKDGCVPPDWIIELERTAVGSGIKWPGSVSWSTGVCERG